ncbi:MAG: sensor histidine kinase [Planctomycetota bacterium]
MRPPSQLPWIVITILAMVLVVAIIVGWSIIFPLYNAAAFTAGLGTGGAGLWISMALGHTFLSLVLVALAWLLTAMLRRHRLLQQQDTFIDTVTHELRTPLAGLCLGIGTLEHRDLAAEPTRDCLQRMHADLERLQALIDHLIEANRLAHGRREVLHRRFDLSELLDACVDRIGRRYGLEEGWCSLQAPAGPVVSDRAALEAIVLNLLDNAVKYAQGRPVVALDAHLEDGYCRLRVADHGVGFTPAQRRLLFRRFVRLQAKGDRTHGCGLGLSILAGLCDQLGGRYSAHSEGPGRGACFQVELPASRPTAPEGGSDA